MVKDARLFYSRAIEFALNATVSDEIDITNVALVGIFFPAAFTDTTVYFDAYNNVSNAWVPIYRDDGVQLSTTIANNAARAVGLDGIAGYLAPWAKIRLRTTSQQAAKRTILVNCKA